RLQAIETITENSLRLRQEEDEIAQSKTTRRSLEEKRSQALASLINEEGRVTALKDTYESIRSDLERSREDLFEVRYEITRRKNHIDHLEQTCSDCRRRLEQNREESRGENRQLEELKRENIDISAELEMQSRQKSVLEEDRDVLQNKISETEKESRENALTISALKEKQTRLESQLESLQNLHDTFEGYSEGVRSIMAKKAAVEKSPDGIEGVVADIIETEPSLERAVEAILGEKLQFMLVKNQNEGIEAIQYLKTEALGRGTFVPMNNAKLSLFEGQPTSASFVGATPLMEKMRVREGCEPLIRYLLGDVFLVDDLSQALALWKTDTLNHTFVTVGGDIVDPLGIITGGANSGDGNGLLGKRREIEELKEKVASATDQWQFFLNKQNEIDRLLEDNRNSLISVQEQLVQLKLSLQNRERDLHQNQEGISRVERKIEFLLLENEKVTGELAELEEDLRTSRCELEDLEIRESELGKTFSSLQEKENDHREKIESQEKQFHQCKIDSMEIQARISSLTSAIELREKALENGRNEIFRCDRICQESEKETEALKISIARAHERLNSMSREYQEYQDKVNHLETALSEERDSLLEEEGILKATQQSLNDLQPLIQEIDHELNVLLSQKRYLEEKIGSKYHLSLKDAAEQGSPEDHHGEDEGDQLERLEQIRDRMMEEINFNAQKEYEEQIEKYQFYQSQSEDLRQSLDSLQEAIQKINRTSRERFRNTFHQVNENFKKLLPLVFEGGQGELRLTDEHDLLETGVEIMVRPIGKQLKNINLLSGGEKALSALTLLFSLYLFKPSPFCLLDEVDSPLDDANIGRFITILKEFSSNSQFIIITHNKNTMEIADNLYGITMEEPGVSKIVSVSLN
ncbi:MAG: chromosome segregation protein SMC, partial [Deltaproteobacteria bacterium]|nr:chromosome segregation protein SMC [Deltaproteobacteria bacterium]